MQHNLFGLSIIQNLDDMEEALVDYEIDEFYVSIDREEGEWKATFHLTVDGEILAETEGWSSTKSILVEDLYSVFGEDLDIVDL